MLKVAAMAPMKRHSAALDDDRAGQEVIFTEGASSSLRQSQVGDLVITDCIGTENQQSKRQRLADLHDSHEDRDSSPLSDADDLDLQQASQYAEQQRMAGDMDNMEADNGIIESITCQNFMCHAHLDIRLGPLINFVVGRNGSGKSAILTALAICLGGKASSTNRGQSLKSFIMTGQEFV